MVTVEVDGWEHGDFLSYSVYFCEYFQFFMIKYPKGKRKYSFSQVILRKWVYTQPQFNKFQKLEIVCVTFHDHNAEKLKFLTKLKNETKHATQNMDSLEITWKIFLNNFLGRRKSKHKKIIKW